MKTAISDFIKSKDFLVCVDSDGCAIDTMDIKHQACFGPAVIDVWPKIEEIRIEFLDLWNHINLYSQTRGINRFKGLVMSFEALQAKGYEVEDFSSIKSWVEGATSLSNPALKEEIHKNEDPQLIKALKWSNRVNELIDSLGDVDRPFENVKEGLASAHEYADIAIVSSANTNAVAHEWSKHGLSQFVEVLCGQEAGSKSYCISALKESGKYPIEKVLMIGDAPGDLQAAKDNGVFFYPIIPGKESESWIRFKEEALESFLSEKYKGEYQEMLINEYEDSLK